MPSLFVRPRCFVFAFQRPKRRSVTRPIRVFGCCKGCFLTPYRLPGFFPRVVSRLIGWAWDHHRDDGAVVVGSICYSCLMMSFFSPVVDSWSSHFSSFFLCESLYTAVPPDWVLPGGRLWVCVHCPLAVYEIRVQASRRTAFLRDVLDRFGLVYEVGR